MTTSLNGIRFEKLEKLLEASGLNSVHAKPLYSAIHRKLLWREHLLEEKSILPPVQRWLHSDACLSECRPKQVAVTPSSDGYTQKYLLRLSDGADVESVQMGFPGRFTACLSSQVGCAMGCVFCATGQMGFSRNLTAGEIVAQAQHIERHLRKNSNQHIRNIVMMGMGEPLHNYESVLEALDILTDTRGLNIGPSRVAISTVGHIPGILRLARDSKRYSLVVSLHGASDEERAKLIPVNKKWPLADLLEACREYTLIKRARVFIAWTLIKGVNDSIDHAKRLVDLLRGMNVHINLIPLNPTDGFEGGMPSREQVSLFQQIILDAGIASTVRQRRGIDVAAGCGQLAAASGDVAQ